MASIDHLVLATARLDEGAAWLEHHLGVPLVPGGRHAAMGTHNRLLRLGPALYLELIAIDPDRPAPGRARWFGLDDPAVQARLRERPRLIHWVARTADIAGARAACPEPLGEILALSRNDLRWRITVPDSGHPPGDGLVPSLIQWDVPEHPAARLPEAGCALMKLEGFHPEPARIRTALAALGLAGAMALFPADPGEAPGLTAYLETPAGLRQLD
jgi:hypothetical protein